MRRLSGCLLVLACAVVLLGAGSLLPRLAFSDEGVGGYAGEKRAFARFALVCDLGLREWPFPVDPTVARRVTQVSGNRDAGSPCTSQEVPEGQPLPYRLLRGRLQGGGGPLRAAFRADGQERL